MTRNAEHYYIGMSKEDDTVPETNKEDYVLVERIVAVEEASSQAAMYEHAGEKIEVEKAVEVLQIVSDKQKEQAPKIESSFEAWWQQRGCRNDDGEWK